jgi:adenylate cyclase
MFDSIEIARQLTPLVIASAKLPMNEMHAALCEHLNGLGIPLWRSSLGLELLHPEDSGARFVWTRAGTEVVSVTRQEMADNGEYDKSPAKVIDDTGKHYRRRLDRPAEDMPMLEAMRREGATDYVIFRLPFRDGTRTAFLSFSTTAEGGFDDPAISALETAANLLSPYAESYVLRRLAVDLLNTYLGPRTGERVFSGAIDRGSFDVIEAVFLMADMRTFTRFSETQPIGHVVASLNQLFSAIVDAVEASGGEVLKFMGDGLLAIFPSHGDIAEPCRAALAAVRSALANLDAINRERMSQGHLPLAAGMALHAGEVAYGNIGARLRLDFTTIGSAINFTSRLVGLAKQLDVPVAISSTVQQHAGEPLRDLGTHALRDIEGLESVYTLP